jgi:putative ABC transport system permease protein
MNAINLIFKYSARLVIREWRKFLLPFFSLLITVSILILILLVTTSGTSLLNDQARELQGGDVVLSSTSKIDVESFLQSTALQPELISEQMSFSGTLESDFATTPFSVQVADNNYPLYGNFTLVDGVFSQVGENEIYLDVNGAEKLQVELGDSIYFGEAELKVAGIIASEPTSVFGGFRFLPRAIFSFSSFYKSKVDPALLRVDYIDALKFEEKLTFAQISETRSFFKNAKDVDVDIAGQDNRGLQFGLQTVSDFLVVSILITMVLASVNVYAGMLYFVTIERKSLAILLALGLTKNKLSLMLGTALSYIVLLSSLGGVMIGIYLFTTLQSYLDTNYLIKIPSPDFIFYGVVSTVIIFFLAVSAFIPAIKNSLAFNPKQILIDDTSSRIKTFSLKTIIKITLITLLPLTVIAIWLFGSVYSGVGILISIILIYVSVSLVFVWVLNWFYRNRFRYNFFVRSIINQKKSDGLFGTISFTSLFIALTALSTLVLLQSSIKNYLQNDLSNTIPTTYILDVQPSQKSDLKNNFPQLELFSNTRARLLAIDNLQIQDEITKGNPNVERELGREFNLTSRKSLLASEVIVSGNEIIGQVGEVSVDEEFAKRANIKIGSQLVFLIQGFEVEVMVTSLRQTDSRSGLPFFYFILSPDDLERFPSVYFGFSYDDTEVQKQLGKYIAQNAPNISMIETQTISLLVIKIISILSILILAVTIPPLLIATLLITTLVIFSYSTRRREGGRFRALGFSQKKLLKQYLLETIFLTLIATVFAYFLSIIINFLVMNYFFDINNFVWFDLNLIIGLALILFFIISVAFYLFKNDNMPLRELLSYETNF